MYSVEIVRLRASNKAATLWAVNIVSFILFLVLTLTGLINWAVNPWRIQRRRRIPDVFQAFPSGDT
jgi:hypothetical protein